MIPSKTSSKYMATESKQQMMQANNSYFSLVLISAEISRSLGSRTAPKHSCNVATCCKLGAQLQGSGTDRSSEVFSKEET